eukprot:MONOS_9019.1-p1 / transcript=MONOS_9019.1 / gene=MONOS_9019 / organism=Monocercomonoides_exilis_PA203 / gene_product=unspecified product / transcript_product=unspecified product / location=Mono_scaffold00358:14494-19063(-) / protein_length=1183 / sequence_SO=supercontig / SO=protein_coding / is_pseudo=false
MELTCGLSEDARKVIQNPRNPPDQYISCTFYNRGLKNVTGIDKFVNLQKLNLSENGIVSLGPIARLRKLKVLILSNNNNLRTLLLQDMTLVGSDGIPFLSNPMCRIVGYRSSVLRMLPQLADLDGSATLVFKSPPRSLPAFHSRLTTIKEKEQPKEEKAARESPSKRQRADLSKDNSKKYELESSIKENKFRACDDEMDNEGTSSNLKQQSMKEDIDKAVAKYLLEKEKEKEKEQKMKELADKENELAKEREKIDQIKKEQEREKEELARREREREKELESVRQKMEDQQKELEKQRSKENKQAHRSDSAKRRHHRLKWEPVSCDEQSVNESDAASSSSSASSDSSASSMSSASFESSPENFFESDNDEIRIISQPKVVRSVRHIQNYPQFPQFSSQPLLVEQQAAPSVAPPQNLPYHSPTLQSYDREAAEAQIANMMNEKEAYFEEEKRKMEDELKRVKEELEEKMKLCEELERNRMEARNERDKFASEMNEMRESIREMKQKLKEKEDQEMQLEQLRAEVEEEKARRDEFIDEIDELKDKLTSAQKQNKSISSELSDLRDECSRLQREKKSETENAARFAADTRSVVQDMEIGTDRVLNVLQRMERALEEEEAEIKESGTGQKKIKSSVSEISEWIGKEEKWKEGAQKKEQDTLQMLADLDGHSLGMMQQKLERLCFSVSEGEMERMEEEGKRVAEMEERLKEEKKKKEAIKDALETAENELIEKEVKIEEMKKVLAEWLKKEETWRAAMSEAEENQRVLNGKIESERETGLSLKKKLKMAEEKADEAEKEHEKRLKEEKAKRSELEQQLRDIQIECDKQIGKMRQKMDKLVDIEKERMELEFSVERMKKEVEEANEERDKALKRFREAEEKKKAVEAEKTELEKKMSDISEKLQVKDILCDAQAGDVQRQKEELEKLRKDLSAAKERNGGVDEERERLFEQISEKEKEIEDLLNENEQLSESKSILKDKLRQLKEQNAEKDEALNLIEKELTAFQHEFGTIQSELSKSKSNAEKAEKENAELKQRLEKNEDLMREKENESLILHEKVKEIEATVDSFQSIIKEKDRSIKNALQKAKQKEEDFLKTQKELMKSEKERLLMKERLRQLHRAFSSLPFSLGESIQVRNSEDSGSQVQSKKEDDKQSRKEKMNIVKSPSLPSLDSKSDSSDNLSLEFDADLDGA